MDIAKLAQAALEESRAPSTIHPSLLDVDFGFAVTNPEQAKALESARRFCSDMIDASQNKAARRHRWRWLTYLGKQGRGKTHLARGIADWRATRGPGRTFYRWIDILSDCRRDSDNIPRFVDRCNLDRLMVVDDIGSGNETDFSASLLFELFERRLGKPTVLTANLTVEGIAGIDPRLASRLYRGGSEVFSFIQSPDFDLDKKP